MRMGGRNYGDCPYWANIHRSDAEGIQHLTNLWYFLAKLFELEVKR
jgi:hypothetical protein